MYVYDSTRYVYVADSQTEGAGEGLWVKTDIRVRVLLISTTMQQNHFDIRPVRLLQSSMV